MKHQIKRFSILQTGKIMGILYALLGLLAVPFGLLAFAMGDTEPELRGLSFVYLCAPVIYGVMGFIFGILTAWLYNLIAGWVGGIEFEMTQVSPSGQG